MKLSKSLPSVRRVLKQIPTRRSHERPSFGTSIVNERYYKTVSRTFSVSDKAQAKQNTMDNTNKQRRRYPNVREPYALSSVTKKLVRGSSIVKRISRDLFPEDVSVHADPESKTENKIEIVEKYKISTPIVSLVSQDGTSTILKERGKSVEQIIEGKRSIITVATNFSTGENFVCEVPPLKSSIGNSDVNKKIEDVNLSLQDSCHEFPIVELMPLCKEIKNWLRMNDLYFDKSHFNYQFGLPFLCNII